MTQIPVLVLAETAMPTARSVIDQTVAHMSDECVYVCVCLCLSVCGCVYGNVKSAKENIRQGKMAAFLGSHSAQFGPNGQLSHEQ